MTRIDDQLLANVIDIDAAMLTLQARLRDEAIFYAAGMVKFDCGHLRPTNRHIDTGATHPCLLCGPRTVVSLELIETTAFPLADALTDLPVAP